VLTFVASVVVFGESGSPPMILGITLVTVGIIVAQLRRRSTVAGVVAAAAEPRAPTPPGAAT
jgi:drug/metabolite transporter (DMT)-like permease